MAKDLRSLLEPANKGAASAATTAPLAQRRNLMSPGEPRVFRVKSGYVCGLCGRLHSGLEPAFNCLGRCTIELRLRSPSGRTSGDAPSHHACTACGRGFANADDAEECFERCLVRLKPTPQFEAALRRVQIRYVQRLQAHGVRPLQRIDPFSEHTKMLATLTREQEAMGRPVARVERPSRAVTELKPTPEAVEIKNPEQFALPLDAAEEPSVSAQTSPGLPETFQETTTSQVSVAGEPHFEAESTETSLSELPTTAPASAAAEISASTEASLSIEEMEMENDLMAGLDIQEDNEHQTPSLQKSSDTQKSESSDSADLNALLEGGESISDANVSLPMNLQESISSETSLDLSPTESGLEDLLATSNNELSPSGSALSMLALSTQTNTLPASEVASQASKTGDGLDNFNVNLLNGATNDLSGAFAEASDFANVADQPETNLLAADVLALLQTNQADERIEVRSNDKKILQEKSVKIDENLLDSVSEAIDESAGTTVFLRKEGMKPYRRNNAKYSCSACSSDFFTKEQVDACFYSHPEEGSEEAKALLAKVKNSPKKSVA